MSKLPAHLRFPTMAPAVVEEPREEIREYQEERESLPALELLEGMTLTDFRRSGLVVVVRCSVLKDEVVWAADDTEATLQAFDEKGRVIYHGEELRLLALLGAHPEDLRAYHSLRMQVGKVQVESVGMAPPDEVKEEKPKKRGAAA